MARKESAAPLQAGLTGEHTVSSMTGLARAPSASVSIGSPAGHLGQGRTAKRTQTRVSPMTVDAPADGEPAVSSSED